MAMAQKQHKSNNKYVVFVVFRIDFIIVVAYNECKLDEYPKL